MLIRFVFLTCALILANLDEVSATPAEMDAYIIFGQSNANGRSYRSELSNEALREDFSNNLFYAYRERSWQNGSTPVDIPLGVLRPDPRDRIGVEVTLGRLLAAHSPRPVLLVKFCSGGTSIVNFLPETNNLYSPMLEYLQATRAEAKKLGYRVRWQGAFVITGESDSSAKNAGRFKDRFVTVKTSLEEDLGIESLPVVYSLLRSNWVDTPAASYSNNNASADQINREMTALAAGDPSVKVTASNADLKTRLENGDSKTDGIHYDSDSYARLGFRLYATAFPDRGTMIDRNDNGVSDLWELRYPGEAGRSDPAAQRQKKIAASSGDSDKDGISDWAEGQLAGFDADNSDSFQVGQELSDLPILLSMLDGQSPRISTISTTWTADSPTHTTATLGTIKVDWQGAQHATTASGGAVVTTNTAGPKPIEHVVTFTPGATPLRATVSGIGKNGSVSFDSAFTVIDNPDHASQEGLTIKGNPNTDSRVTLEFGSLLSRLIVTVAGNDATMFKFSTDIELPVEPLKWRK